MKKLYSPETELDLIFIKSLLESEGISFFVHNDYFGSLKIGPKIDLLNDKTIFVDESGRERASEVIDSYLEATNESAIEPKTQSAYSITTKLRIVIEALIFNWFIPQGRNWKRHN